MCLDLDGNLWLGLDNGIDYVEINSPVTLMEIWKIRVLRQERFGPNPNMSCLSVRWREISPIGDGSTMS